MCHQTQLTALAEQMVVWVHMHLCDQSAWDDLVNFARGTEHGTLMAWPIRSFTSLSVGWCSLRGKCILHATGR